ncbi:sugar ABC transporter ATP-binding protein [Bacillus pinisoli]|uniref:sugar ABC transporter ATP-binding protein n=1 Tax=Bacillus pinisoli TaxID=2901866 RepID=UPI001FF35080|nr:sugar ABC transporter ATP-binding protein [Bacillus pinisoli]
MGENLLQMTGISIEFPGVKALDQVDFSTEAGRVQALIGANGAGKSTLMKVLSGAYSHYTGEIKIDGKQVVIRSPKDAKDVGIQIVYQEVDTALIPSLSVGENILMNDTIHSNDSNLFINWKKLHQKASSLINSMNLKIPSKKLVSELTLAEKQMVLIARAISTDCKFLILDEPTAPLSHSETKELFRIVSELKDKGVGIIFISHRLPEIFQICDDITVMRNGQHVSRCKVTETSQHKVVEQMLGKSLEDQFPSYEIQVGETLFLVENLSDYEKVKDIDLEIKSGEIVGVAGLVGAGKTELCNALFGHSKISTGKITLKGKQLRLSNPYAAVQAGIALVPEERRKQGIFVNEDVTTNLSVSNLSAFTKLFSFIDRKKESNASLQMIRNLGVKTPSEHTLVQHLSGGNQQKIAIGKWLVADADVYIFDEPTKGVDVGAKKDIFNLMVNLAERGKAIIYATSELSEIMGITSRMYVMYDGKIVKELKTNNTTEEEILYYSAGGK